MVQHLILAQLVPLPLAAICQARRRPPALLSWIIGIAVVIGTSVPPAYQLARDNVAVDWAFRAVLLFTGLLFWLPLVGRASRIRLTPAAALVYAITACFATTLAGAYIAFSATTTDQQIAGLIMWVPCCIIYLTAALGIVIRAMLGARPMAGQQLN
jgi:cytochrome c oxidase assembly factor CtaG